jgi:hypothetical protein
VSTDSEEKERSVVPREAIQPHESAKWRKETGVLFLSLSLWNPTQGEERGESTMYWSLQSNPTGREGGAANLLRVRGISPGSSHDYLTGVLVYGQLPLNEMFSKNLVYGQGQNLQPLCPGTSSRAWVHERKMVAVRFFSLERTKTFIVIDLSC